MSIFEVPSFISMPAVGIDISTDAVRFVEFKKVFGKYVVGKYDSIKIPAGIVQAGSVEDSIGLSIIMKDMASKYNLTTANVALPEEQSFLVQMDFQNIEKKDLRSIIELHLEEYVPIAPSDCTFDYTIIPSDIEGTISVIVCVFPSKIIEQYIQVFKDTNITPKTFELQSTSMARAIFPKISSANDTYMGVDIGKDITNIFIVKNGVVHFSAILDIGGDNISTEISKSMQVSFDEADKLKLKDGLLTGEPELKNAIKKVLDLLKDDILKYFAFWNSKNEQASIITDVYLTGGSANLDGIAEYLGQGLNANVNISNPWINIFDFDNYIPQIDLNTSHGYAAAIGLALKDVEQ